MADFRLLAIAAFGLALACASPPAAICDLSPPGPQQRYAGVEVALAPGLPLAPATAARAAAVTRQSALDWLDQRGQLDPGGGASVTIIVESARLRWTLTAWLFAWAAPPDHLAARVSLRRAAEREPRCAARVESALAGWSWRNPEARLDRLARRLGQRVAEGL